MFTMQMACDLNLLYNVCDFEGGLSFMESLKQAAENGAFVRLLVKPDPFDGVESSVALEQFVREMESAGLSDRYEVRLFQGPMHFKSTLVDGEFLIVGSQNFHYSAFGNGGLTEYSLGIGDPEAATDFEALFDYHWQRAERLEIDGGS